MQTLFNQIQDQRSETVLHAINYIKIHSLCHYPKDKNLELFLEVPVNALLQTADGILTKAGFVRMITLSCIILMSKSCF